MICSKGQGHEYISKDSRSDQLFQILQADEAGGGQWPTSPMTLMGHEPDRGRQENLVYPAKVWTVTA